MLKIIYGGGANLLLVIKSSFFGGWANAKPAREACEETRADGSRRLIQMKYSNKGAGAIDLLPADTKMAPRGCSYIV